MKLVKIAAINTFTERGENCDQKNIAYAWKAMEEAASNGVDIVCFPETFPGSLRVPVTFDPFEEMAAKAKELKIHVVYGAAVNAAEFPGKQYIREVLVGPDGKEIGHYDRTCPQGPGGWYYRGGAYWDLDYATASRLPVFDTALGKIGMLVCSEVYLPELSRALASQGAELIFIPAGVNKNALAEGWEILLKARAIENLACVVSCNNLCDIPNLDDPNGAYAVIATPEGVIGEKRDEGILYGEVDLDRIHWLRDTEDTWEAAKVQPVRKAKPGIFKQWVRPEIWKDII